MCAFIFSVLRDHDPLRFAERTPRTAMCAVAFHGLPFLSGKVTPGFPQKLHLLTVTMKTMDVVRVRLVDRCTFSLQSRLPARRQNCADDAENPLLFGMGRPQPLVCDFHLFRLWLKLCENRHNHTAEAQFPPLICDIRLIDLRDHCLITLGAFTI
jgi:hypothetical protein